MPDVPWFVYAMVLAPFGLIVVAAIYKMFQVRAASRWPSTTGKVVISTSEVRNVSVLDDTRDDHKDLEPRNFANIVYEYNVSGQTLRNNRVSIGEDRGNFQVAETIARYPVGKAVTVYYNPLHPREAVLERELPGIGGCLAILGAIVLVGVFGGAIGIKRISDFVAAHLADPKLSPLVIAFGAFGTVIALFGLAIHRQSALARTWPTVQGIIKLTPPEIYQAADSDSGRSGPLMYRRRVLYNYKFNNIAYSGIHVTVSSSSKPAEQDSLRSFGKDYRNGASVTVYVDPANPTQATLSPGGAVAWLLWALALGFLVAGYFVATRG